MSWAPAEDPHVPAARRKLLPLAALSLVVGLGSGLLCGAFRLALGLVESWRNEWLSSAGGWKAAGLLAVTLVCAAAVSASAWIVRRFAPQAAGSGIPHVEAVLTGEAPPAGAQVVPVKFAGGLLAIGSGLALGREGPSVQMGASVGRFVGLVFRRDAIDCRLLLAGGAGAGLAVAFNAPLAGAAFVLEELTRRFDPRTAIATFGASVSAIAVGRILLGTASDFRVGPLPHADFASIPLFLALGVVAGLLGVAYNRTILGALALAGRLDRFPVELRAAAVGAATGALAWFAPGWVGSGDVITQRALSGADMGGLLVSLFLFRFVFGPVSYAARTPGGLFAPLLALGAQSGLLFGTCCQRWLPGVAPGPVAYALAGMAAFFTATVRAPLTGIILVIELTGSHTLLPLLAACFPAMLVPTLVDNPPIYDSLKQLGARAHPERAS